MRITKEIAYNVALGLTNKSKKACEKLETEFQLAVVCAYDQQIPDLVKSTFKKFPEWFARTDYITLRGHGFNHESVFLKKQAICNNGSNSAFLAMDDEIGSALQMKRNAHAKARKKYSELLNETAQTLMDLRTYKRISEVFPSAMPFLPKEMSTSLIVNIDSLLLKLDRQSVSDIVDQK